MRVLRWLIYKDMSRFLSDRQGAALTFVIPMVLAALLGTLFGQAGDDTKVELLVVDKDQSVASRSLVEAMSRDETLSVSMASEAEAREMVEKGDAAVAVILPKGAGDVLTPLAMFAGKPIPVALLHDPSKKVEASLCSGLITKIIMEEVGKQLGDPKLVNDMMKKVRMTLALAGQGDPSAQGWIAVLDDAMKLTEPTEEDSSSSPSMMQGGMKPPLALEKEAVTAAGPAAGYNSYAHSFAGMLCMFLLFWALDAGKELIQERQNGSLLRVRMSSASRGQALAARAISATVVAILMSLAVYALGMTVFGIEVLGSVAGFVLVLLSQAIFIGGMTLLLVGVSRSERQMMNIGSFVVLMMSFLGGAWMPSFILPDWVQGIALVLPTHWGTEGLAAMTWRGLGFEAAIVPSAMLCLEGAVCATIGWIAYRWD
jgi:ABC-2 type transport system permease protein